MIAANNPPSYTFTVFTPTYNRAHTLHRVYDSLRAQTLSDFEWLVVDDGSTDGTRRLIEYWQRQTSFPIRYVFQENGGKHVAFNRGVQEARGELFLPFDSDDACVPHALERFLHHWRAIPAADSSRFTGVTALCANPDGTVIGSTFPRDVIDSDSLEMRYRFGTTGEKWGFHRTVVLRAYPFPEAVLRECVPESIVWAQIARQYKTRFVNELLRVYYTDQPSLLRRDGRAQMKTAGARLAEALTLNRDLDYFWYAPLAFCQAAARYVRYSWHTGRAIRVQALEIAPAMGKCLWCAALPVGTALYLHDRWRARHVAPVALRADHG